MLRSAGLRSSRFLLPTPPPSDSGSAANLAVGPLQHKVVTVDISETAVEKIRVFYFLNGMKSCSQECCLLTAERYFLLEDLEFPDNF